MGPIRDRQLRDLPLLPVPPQREQKDLLAELLEKKEDLTKSKADLEAIEKYISDRVVVPNGFQMGFKKGPHRAL